jgi:catechol 2,3-dioxygenase-like lactoylglutathione lyase family enzyme
MTLLVESVRRTTITTYDMEASLGFYRDTLGMSVWYDVELADQVVCETYDLPAGTRTRVCILQSREEGAGPGPNDLVSGMIGLMHFEGLPAPPAPVRIRRPGPGEIVVMFSTTRMRELEARLLSGGHDLLGPPIRLDAPGRAVVYELLARDPNGVRVAFSQLSEIDPA